MAACSSAKLTVAYPVELVEGGRDAAGAVGAAHAAERQLQNEWVIEDEWSCCSSPEPSARMSADQQT
jgi:hypothetical protein